MHHTDAAGLEIIISLPFPVRIDEELHAGILIDVPTEIHLTGGCTLFEHVVTQHEMTACMECAEHYARLVWSHFRPADAVNGYRLTLCQRKKKG